MTIMAWHKRVQNKQTLTYEVSGNFGGPWMTVIKSAIDEFNQQMTTIGLKLSLTPVAKGMGPHITLDTEPGNGLHGRGALQPMTVNGKTYLDSVKIFVPATPRISLSDPKSREVGPNVRLCILVHELIHAVGLTNDEHSEDDVFSKKAGLLVKGSYMKSPDQAAEDMCQPFDGSAPMPPIRIGSTTISNLKKAWP